MSETKFTKGEWGVVRSDGYHGFYVEDSNGYTVADLYFMSKTSGLSVDHGDNPEANAHLISAAPLMYEMLKRLSAKQWDASEEEEIENLLAKARGEK